MTVQQQNNNQQPDNNQQQNIQQQQATPQAPDLQTISQNYNMQTGNASEDSAADSTAEDTLSRLFEQSQAQVAQLVEQNKSLQDQIGLLLRNGASVTDNNGTSTPNDNSQTIGNLTQAQLEYRQSEDYVSLADLGREVGKRDYENHNLEK